MKAKAKVTMVILVLCAVAGGYRLLMPRSEIEPVIVAAFPVPVSRAIVPAIGPPPPTEPVILHPLSTEPVLEALPELNQSDAPFLNALGKVLGKKGLAVILPEELIHRIVVTVDNLPRPKLPAAIVPLKRAEGRFLVTGREETLVVSAHNAERYAVYVKLIQSIDAAKLVAVYRAFYPLFQRAYDQLGYPKAYFNDRLVDALDDLLAVPEIDEPIHLTQPKVLFEFANTETEARSAGQKILIRMGRENVGKVQIKLKEVRQLVTLHP